MTSAPVVRLRIVTSPIENPSAVVGLGWSGCSADREPNLRDTGLSDRVLRIDGVDVRDVGSVHCCITNENVPDCAQRPMVGRSHLASMPNDSYLYASAMTSMVEKPVSTGR